MHPHYNRGNGNNPWGCGIIAIILFAIIIVGGGATILASVTPIPPAVCFWIVVIAAGLFAFGGKKG